MDLQQLRTFTAIAREGSLARASERLCLSQPAVSAQLKALESELRVKLFDRTPKGMSLTFAGQSLLQEASNALLAASNVSAKARHLQGDATIGGEFKLGTVSEPVVLRLGELLCALVDAHPALKLSLSQGVSGDVVQRIVQREIHAGYVIGAPGTPAVKAIQIAPIALRVVAPLVWQDKLASATWQDIALLPWLSTPEKCSFRHIAARMFARHGVQPQTLIEADQEHTLRDLVAQGMGLSLLREDIAKAGEAAGQLALWPPGIETDHLYFIHLEEEGGTPVMQAIVALVRQVWRV